MRFAAWKAKWVMLMATALVAACGEVEGPAYEGEPLATFKGQLTSTGEVTAPGGVRMALAWFSHMGASGVGQPAGIITEEVVYQGEFPINYAFSVTKPPPIAALADLSEGGGPKRGAVGVLLAYEDLNGNGQLDTIPVSGQPIDKVLGASMDFYAFDGIAVVYVDQPAGPDGDPLSQKLGLGFNLFEARPPASGDPADEPTVEVVPASTLIPIALTGDPALNIYVCDEVWSGQALDEVPCGIVIEWPEPVEEIFVGGMLAIDETGAWARLDVMKKDVNVTNATVTLDGTTLLGDGFGSYEVHDASGALLSPGGTHTVQVSVPGETPVSHTVTMPGDFSILSPTHNGTVAVGQPFTATWSASAGAIEYAAQFEQSAGGFSFEVVEGTSWTAPGYVANAGTARFSVSARGPMTSAVTTVLARYADVVCQ